MSTDTPVVATRRELYLAARQVLMNELGLNRGEVRKMVAEELNRLGQAYVEGPTLQSMIENMIKTHIGKLISDRPWSTSAVSTMLQSMVHKEIEKQIVGKIEVKIIQ